MLIYSVNLEIRKSESIDAIKKVLAKWTGFDPLNKSTWGLKSRSNIIPNWTDEQKQKICVYLRKPLFVKDDELILRFVDGIVNLTIDKERDRFGFVHSSATDSVVTFDDPIPTKWNW